MKNHLLSFFCISSLALTLNLFLSSFAYSQSSASEYFRLGNTAFQQENYSSALKNYQSAIEKDPKFALAYHNLGNVQYLMNDYPAALQSYSQAILLNPKEVAPYSSRGALYFALKKNVEALADFNKAVQINPQYAQAFYLRGQVYEAQKEIDKANEDWKIAASLGYEPAKVKLGEAPTETARIPNLTDPTDKQRPSSVAEFIEMGKQYMEQREYNVAITYFSKAIQKDKKAGEAYFGRGSAYFAIGKQEEACKDWKMALQNGYEPAAEMIAEDCGI